MNEKDLTFGFGRLSTLFYGYLGVCFAFLGVAFLRRIIIDPRFITPQTLLMFLVFGGTGLFFLRVYFSQITRYSISKDALILHGLFRRKIVPYQALQAIEDGGRTIRSSSETWRVSKDLPQFTEFVEALRTKVPHTWKPQGFKLPLVVNVNGSMRKYSLFILVGLGMFALNQLFGLSAKTEQWVKFSVLAPLGIIFVIATVCFLPWKLICDFDGIRARRLIGRRYLPREEIIDIRTATGSSDAFQIIATRTLRVIVLDISEQYTTVDLLKFLEQTYRPAHQLRK